MREKAEEIIRTEIYKIMREIGCGQITSGRSCQVEMSGLPYPFWLHCE